jgi:uncharacterized protein DUF6518
MAGPFNALANSAYHRAVTWRRTGRLLAIALLFGVAAGVLKGPSGDGRGALWEVRSALANISTPWVLIAWFAGSRSTRIGSGILLGLAATVVALVGFYVVCGVVEAMRNDVVSSSMAWMSANRVWFEAGMVSGPLFGALGAWWARRRSPSAFAVAGLLMVGGIVPGFGVSGTASIAVHVVEIAAGAALLLLGRRRRDRPSASTATV